MPRITDRQRFPDMAVGLIPVDEAAAVLRVDRHVGSTAWCAAAGDAACLDAREDGVEFTLADAKAIVQHRKLAFGLIEVDCKAVADIDR